MNKNELDDFVHTVKAARTAQKVVAVVDQHPNFCLFSITTTNRVVIFPLNIIYFNQILSLLSIRLLPCQHGFQQRSGRANFVSKLCNYFLVYLETHVFSHTYCGYLNLCAAGL